MQIKKENCIALAIDYQEKLVPVMAQREALIEKSVVLLKGLSLLKIPMIFTEQYRKGLGPTIEPLCTLFPAFSAIDKITFSAYQQQEVKKQLQKSGKTTVLLFGIEAHICVLQTLLDLHQAKYTVVFVQDAVSSRFPIDKDTAILRAKQEGAILTTVETILFELTQTAKNPVFKQISALIK